MIISKHWGKQKPPLGVRHNMAHPLSNGLVGHWLMNEGGGATLYDVSGNGRNGAFGAGAASPAWRPGFFGPALDFDGGDNVSLGTLAQPTLFSISARIKGDSLGGGSNRAVVSFGFNFAGNQGALFLVDTGGFISWLFGSTDNTTLATGALSTGTWYHVAGTANWSTGATQLFVNGQLVHSQTISVAPGWATTSNLIGNDPGGTTGSDGIIDDIRIYNRIVTSAEFALLYAQPFADMVPMRIVVAPSVEVIPPAPSLYKYIVNQPAMAWR